MPLHARGLTPACPDFSSVATDFGLAPSLFSQQSAGKRTIDIFGCNPTQTRALALAYL